MHGHPESRFLGRRISAVRVQFPPAGGGKELQGFFVRQRTASSPETRCIARVD
jgi:hypothetical protein